MVTQVGTSPIVGLGQRHQHLDQLRHGRFDLLVVGGGITGAGVAWDAATRGLRVALVEQHDFAGGTSSRSTKLLHGGLRYLQQADISLVREALRERNIMGSLAPHLVEMYPFLFPIFHGWRERLTLAAGLTLYDLLASLSDASVPRHTWLSRAATGRLAPGIATAGLQGSFVYRDAQTDDARMVVEVLGGAVAHGATVVNRVAMREVTRLHGSVTGAVVENRVSGETIVVDAAVVVVAAGVWLDQVVAPTPGLPRVRPAKGVHLFVPLHKLPIEAAVYSSTTRDGRLFFIVPWLGVAMIGTTDSPYEGDLASPVALAAEMEYLLDATNRAFPEAHLTADDVLATQAGLRPLVSMADKHGQPTRTMSREDRVWEAEPGVVAIAGGKLTTFRHMAQRAVNLASKRLRPTRGAGDAVTMRSPLGGFTRPMPRPEFVAWRDGATAGVGLDADFRTAMIDRYGARFPALEAIVRDDRSMADRLVPADPAVIVRRAEALYAIRHEQAGSIADVLARRVRVTLLTRDQGRTAARDVAAMFAREYGWSPSVHDQALAAYERDIAENTVPGRIDDRSVTTMHSTHPAVAHPTVSATATVPVGEPLRVL